MNAERFHPVGSDNFDRTHDGGYARCWCGVIHPMRTSDGTLVTYCGEVVAE